MRSHYNDADTSLFDTTESTVELHLDELSKEDINSIEKYMKIISSIDENARKNKSHTFSMGLLIFVLLALCTIVIIEYRIKIENEYTKDLFDFFKYLATTLTGYIFASYNKKDTE